MATYDYVCNECSFTMEINRSIHGEVEEIFCPNDSQIMARVWTAPPIQFNATGFYSTDNLKR